MLAPTTIPFIVAPLMALAIYRRVRGSFGPQRIRTTRMTVRIVLLSLVVGLMMLSGLQDIRLAEGALGGAALGAALAVFVGLRLTRFESGADGADYFVPNPWVGGVLTALLLGRMAWRFLVLAPTFTGGADVTSHTPGPGNSPLTMLVVGLTVGYYLAYTAGVLIHHRRHKRSLQMA